MNGTLKLGADSMVTTLAEIPESERDGRLENALLPDGTPIRAFGVDRSVPTCVAVQVVRAIDPEVWFVVAQEC